MTLFSNAYSASFGSYISSYAAYFQQTVGIELEESKVLCQQATTLEIEEAEKVTSFLQKALSHLARNPCPKLEKILQNKFCKLPTATTIDILKKSVVSLPYDVQSKRIIDVFERFISFSCLKEFSEVQDVRSKAKTLALFLPKPKNSYELLTHSLPSQLHQKNFLFKFINYFVLSYLYSFQINLDDPPKSLHDAQSQFYVYRSLIRDLSTLYKKMAPHFSTTWKVNLIASIALFLTICLSFIGYNLYHKFRVGTPQLNENDFTNLNKKAANGLSQRSIGREVEKQKIITSLSPPSGQPPNIIFLVGDTGSGKSQLMESVALAIEEGEAPELSGKILYSVNTTYFSKEGGQSFSYAQTFGRTYTNTDYSSRLDELFFDLQGHEKEVILFFDEAQNGGGLVSGGSTLLEQMKTKLLEKQILCVFATTTKEYDELIAPNKAFVDRVEIVKLTPLTDQETIEILQARASPEVLIDTDGYQAIVRTSNNHPDYKTRVNPRKSILIQQYVTNIVHSWTPTLITNEIQAKQTTRKALVMLCREMDGKQVDWTQKEGTETVKKIEALNQEIADLEKKKAQQAQAYKAIRLLRKDLNEAWLERAEAVHRLSQEPPLDTDTQEAMGKKLLFIESIQIPLLQEMLTKALEMFKQKFNEEVPLKVDAKLVEKAFPITSS
ncbi:MAG: hypothetical protein HKM07_03715 [Chlamydiae bacterium]|nr:hypothetical protein [Chlamydiota bacterium]